MNVKYNDEEIKLFIETFKECKSYNIVSEIYGVSLSSMKSILNRNGCFVGSRKLKNIEGYVLMSDSIKLLENKNYSFNDLCKELKVVPTTYRNFLISSGDNTIINKCNSKNKKKTSLTEINKTKIINLENEGKGIDVIGKIINIDGGTVRRFLIEHYGKEKYEKRHSIEKFLTPYYSGFTNDRGDRFHSSLEELVADFLYESSVKYKTQSYIKFDNGKFIYPDFYLEDHKIYIEVFGMSSVPFYVEGMNKKIELYNKYDKPMIGLYYENFKKNNWKEILTKKLKLCN